jgi:Zn finger protein HypA/HybF involved in hydrogenase expression
MTLRRDRAATNPGGMQCENCDEIFVGEPWHMYCATCQSWFDNEKFRATDGELTFRSEGK